MNSAMQLTVLSGCMATVWGIVCSPQAIFNVFIRNEMGASSTTLGALVGLLQLSGLFQLASIFIYGLSRRKKPFFVAAHLVHRILTLAIAGGAFMAAAGGDRSFGIRLVMVAVPLSWAFMNASAAGWWSWVADLYPENIRGAFFLRRSSIINVVNVIWFFLASMLLDIFQGPQLLWVYGTIFAVGALSGIVDILLNLLIPEPVQEQPARFAAMDALEPLRNANFVGFSMAVGIAIFSMNMIGPFQAPYVVDPARIAAPKTWLGIMFVISQLTWVLTAPFWGTVMDKWGRKPVVVMGCMFALNWIGYFFISSSNYFYILPLMSIFGGLLAPAFYEGVNQMMLSLAPGRNRIAHVAWYMTIVGVVSAGGSLVGGALLDALSGFAFQFGIFMFEDLHVVQAAALVMVIISAFILSRVKEGRDRPIGFVFSRLATPGILKTYAYLDSIASAFDPGRAEQALRSIESQTGELALDEILSRLDDPYQEIREEAIRALGRIRSPVAVEPLLRHLEDTRSSLRITAIRALGKIKDARAVEPMAAILLMQNTSSIASDDVLEACLHAIGAIGGDRAAAAVGEFWRRCVAGRLRSVAAEVACSLGMFEPANEVLESMLAAVTASARRQSAVALGNLLGAPGSFYRYVSGSSTGIADRVARLFGRLEWKLRSLAIRLGGGGRSKFAKLAGHETARLVQVMRESIEEDREELALRSLVDYARRLLAALFGDQAADTEMVDMAFRADARMGAFAWLVGKAEKLVGVSEASPVPDAGPAESGQCPAMVLPVDAAQRQDVLQLLVLLLAHYLDGA
jgi:MFS family permease